MDLETRKRVEAAGVPRGLWIWIVARPDNPKVTVIDRVTSLFSRLAMFLTAVIVVITFYEVVARYVFFSPTLWVNELSLWLGSMIFLTSGIYAMQRRSHIRITAVYDLVSARVRKVFDFVAMVVVISYAALMIVAGFEVALDTLLRWERFGTFWNPPIPATVKPLVLVSTLLVAVQAINNFWIDRDLPDQTLPPGEGEGEG